MSFILKLFFLVIILIFLNKFNLKEKFYGWIPISSRNTKFMSYDLRGDPIFIKNKRGTPSPFILGMFPYYPFNSYYSYY